MRTRIIALRLTGVGAGRGRPAYGYRAFVPYQSRGGDGRIHTLWATTEANTRAQAMAQARRLRRAIKAGTLYDIWPSVPAGD